MRSTVDLELVPLVKALRNRIDGLTAAVLEIRDGIEVHSRASTPFMQIEIRRDHMNLDLWLERDKLEEARASGIGRAHPFMENEAVRVRFERAEDLTRVAHWVEDAYNFAPLRAKLIARQAAAEAKKRATEKKKAEKAREPAARNGDGAAKDVPAPKVAAVIPAVPKPAEEAPPKKAASTKKAAPKAAKATASAKPKNRSAKKATAKKATANKAAPKAGKTTAGKKAAPAKASKLPASRALRNSSAAKKSSRKPS